MTQSKFDIELEIDTISPKMYKVILHNDDYSTFDFVVGVLIDIFNKKEDEAIDLTFKVDREGYAVVGIYPKEIAETKVVLVKSHAKEAGYPLLATMEEE
jgi:ATP-dependent Clp protease adaptor protein ClpS